MAEKLWGGRFTESTDEMVERLNASIHFDKRLYAQDIEGSIAHLEMLASESIISEEESAALKKGLLQVKEKIESGSMAYSDALEDIHMHVENELGKECPDISRKLHTGRSRNDQIALDVRLYLKDEISEILGLFKKLQKEIAKLAKSNLDVVMPGYTHMQRAQPVLFAHHMMAYFEMFQRDVRRMEDCLERTDAMPLGTAALAGTTYPVNRELVRKLLGFSKMAENSIDAVSDRDFVMEFISGASIAMIHFSRLSEELILWSTSEFDFIRISDAFTTGSSIMPQKKNPDVSELVRGKTGRVVGNLMSIITLMKSLPLAYNKDMQEDKEPLFDTADTLKACIDIYTRMIPHITVKRENMYKACTQGFLNATELADYLAVKGMPFRDAHSAAGKAVARAVEKGCELQDLSVEEFQRFSSLVEKDIYEYLTVESMIRRRISYGGTGYDNVRNAVEKALSKLEEQ